MEWKEFKRQVDEYLAQNGYDDSIEVVLRNDEVPDIFIEEGELIVQQL